MHNLCTVSGAGAGRRAPLTSLLWSCSPLLPLLAAEGAVMSCLYPVAAVKRQQVRRENSNIGGKFAFEYLRKVTHPCLTD